MAALYPWRGKPNVGRAHPSCRPEHAWTFSAACLPAPTAAAAPASHNVGCEWPQAPRRPPRRRRPQWPSPQLGSGWSPRPPPWHLKLSSSPDLRSGQCHKTLDGCRREPPLAHNFLLPNFRCHWSCPSDGQLHGHRHRHRWRRIRCKCSKAQVAHNLAANNTWRTRKEGGFAAKHRRPNTWLFVHRKPRGFAWAPLGYLLNRVLDQHSKQCSRLKPSYEFHFEGL